MCLEAPDVTNPPDVIARPVGFAVRPAHFATDQVPAFRDRFQHRAIAVPATANVIHLAAARSLEKMPKCVNEIEGVNIVPHLLSAVAEDNIGGVVDRAFDEIGEKPVQLSPRMPGAGEAPAAEARSFHAKISPVLLDQDIGGDLRGAE